MKKLLGFILAMIMTLAIFPSAYAADNMYTIDDVYFSNLSGTILENPSRTCLVNIELTKTAERVGEDTVVIASYSTDGKMIGFTTVGGTVERGNKAKFATLVIVPEDKEIGIVKTYVWNNVSEMMPLSEVYTEIVNELDEGVELPSVDQPAVEELYIPETVTVIGIITDVPKSQSGAVENDEYRIEITSAPIECNSATTEEEYNYLKNRYEAMYNIFFGMTISEINESPVTRIMKSTLDLNGYLFYEGRITVNKNYEILNFEPTGSTKAEELNAADYVKSAELAAENQYESNGKVRFGSTYYKLANEVEIYVNGVNVAEVDKTAGDNTTLDTYLGGAQGTVKLVKLADDTNYSKIFVDYYIIGEVTSVTYKSNTTTVNFAGNRDVRKIVIDDDNLEAGDTIVTAKKGDAEIELKDIAKDDIIAVAYNPEEVASNTLTNPSFLTVLATNDTASGKVAGKSTDDETYTIDGKVYGLVDWDGLNGDITVGNTYTLTLDPFGRIYAAEMDATSKNIAVVEKWNSTEEKVTLVLGDGTSKTYEVDCSSADITDVLYSEGTTKARVQDRVVEYTVKTSTGAISRITPIEGTVDTAAEYKDRSGKLGSFSLSDATQILNAEKYVKEVEELEDDEVTVVANGSTSDYAGWTKASLTDGSSYKVYAYNKTSDFYSFVIITKAGSTLSEASRFAVVKTAVEPDSTTDGYECASITALYGGEDVKLYIDAEPEDVDLDYGDAFYFELDSDGLVPVANIYKIYDHSSTTFAGVDALAGLYDEEDWFVPGEGETCFTKNAFDVQLVYGIVTGVKSSAIEFGVVKDNKIDGNKYNLAAGDEGIFDFDIASDCVAYEYDTTSTEIREKNKIDITSASSILASDFSIFENEEDDLIIDYVETDGEDPADYANYAVAMVVDGSIVAIYSIVNN